MNKADGLVFTDFASTLVAVKIKFSFLSTEIMNCSNTCYSLSRCLSMNPT